MKAHDRFLLIDDTVYFVGASSKDLGKKLFAFAKLSQFTCEEILQNGMAPESGKRTISMSA